MTNNTKSTTRYPMRLRQTAYVVSKPIKGAQNAKRLFSNKTD